MEAQDRVSRHPVTLSPIIDCCSLFRQSCVIAHMGGLIEQHNKCWCLGYPIIWSYWQEREGVSCHGSNHFTGCVCKHARRRCLLLSLGRAARDDGCHGEWVLAPFRWRPSCLVKRKQTQRVLCVFLVSIDGGPMKRRRSQCS